LLPPPRSTLFPYTTLFRSYHNFLIGPLSVEDANAPDDIYFTYAPLPDRQNELEEILVKGATNQWNISYGGNIEDRFFFGAGVGVDRKSTRLNSSHVKISYA